MIPLIYTNILIRVIITIGTCNILAVGVARFKAKHTADCSANLTSAHITGTGSTFRTTSHNRLLSGGNPLLICCLLRRLFYRGGLLFSRDGFSATKTLYKACQQDIMRMTSPNMTITIKHPIKPFFLSFGSLLNICRVRLRASSFILSSFLLIAFSWCYGLLVVDPLA